MLDYISLYETYKENAQIAASGSETFFILAADRENKDKHGSFNYLEVINDSNIDILILLDGLTTRTRKLFAKSIMIIKPEENIYYNTVKITNTDGANVIAVSLIRLIGRIMSPYSAPVIAIR